MWPLLERVKIGGSSKITVRSIKKALKDGVPPPLRQPTGSAEAANRPGDEQQHDQVRQEPQVQDEDGKPDNHT